jgi:small subunit ribosomal protein S7
MVRKKLKVKHSVNPDPKYGEILVQKFINKVMWDGKKSLAERIVYGAFDVVAKGKKEAGVDVFKKALDNVRPLVMIESTRIGGATYQVPTEVSLDKSQMIAMRWIISYARSRNEKTMIERLSAEIDDAFHKRGTSFKKREDTHKMAEANKAFAQFNW